MFGEAPKPFLTTFVRPWIVGTTATIYDFVLNGKSMMVEFHKIAERRHYDKIVEIFSGISTHGDTMLHPNRWFPPRSHLTIEC